MALLYEDKPINITEIDNLEQYKRTQKIRFVCSKCNQEVISYRINIKYPLLCRSCKQKNSFSNYNWDIRNEKSKKTKLEKYGDEHFTNSKKIKESLLNKSISEKEDIKKRTLETNLKRYGKHPAQREVQKDKTKQTCIAKYGSTSPFSNKEVQEKFKTTCLEKYGVDNPFKSDEIKAQIKTTCLEKYGVDNPKKNFDIQEKIKETCLEKYGSEHPWSNYDVRLKCRQRFNYKNINFDSSWELYYYIFLEDNNIPFIYQPKKCFEYKNHKYYPDFEVNGKLQEIKGEQFFEGSKMINPYDRTLDEIYEEKHVCMLQNNVEILRKEDLEHVFDFVNTKYGKEFVKLFKNDLEFPYLNQDFKDKSDYGIIHFYHKSIYDASRKNFSSPKEAWLDKNLILKSALNRLKYTNKCTPKDILYGFTVAKIAPKVSVFNPKLATDIIKKYLFDVNEIFDPFSGFSGRLIGAFNNKKTYIGQDINNIHINESKEVAKYLNYTNCILQVKDIFLDTEKKVESVFTCPPYEDKEKWNDDDSNLTCDAWIDLCIEKYDAKKYVFVVDETIKYKDKIVDVIYNESHFNKNNEYIILINNDDK